MKKLNHNNILSDFFNDNESVTRCLKYKYLYRIEVKVSYSDEIEYAFYFDKESYKLAYKELLILKQVDNCVLGIKIYKRICGIVCRINKV